jgi:predicted nucleotidyltransferase component of viral defense system
VIPAASITAWARGAPWPSPDQIEQDLLLSRLICEIATHPMLGDELVFRGGTCLHKLHLPQSLRYSEDLDYVRATHGPIGPLFDALRDVAAVVGMDAATDVGQYPKVFLRSTFESGTGRLQVKVEINTYETSPARPHIRVDYEVQAPWWSGAASVLTFEPAELMATKVRALYQRRKGRDLFDLWLALTQMGLGSEEILESFGPYRPDGYSAALAVANLAEHVADPGFRSDLLDLTTESSGYDVDEAAALVTEQLLRHVDGSAGSST